MSATRQLNRMCVRARRASTRARKARKRTAGERKTAERGGVVGGGQTAQWRKRRGRPGPGIMAWKEEGGEKADVWGSGRPVSRGFE